MKRSEMKRTAFASKPRKEKTDRPARIAHKRGEASIWRSEAYLALVRTLPCVCCGAVGYTQAAHSNQLRFSKGRGIKASDASAMALCGPRFDLNGCHAGLDQGGNMTKRERNQFEDRQICRTIFALADKASMLHHDSRMPAIDLGIAAIAAHLVGMIESGELAMK